MQTLLLWLFYISTFYAFIPGMISRIFGFRVFRKGTGQNEFALTFDDGPDPRFTPLLLDLLKKYDAKATFFVVGSNAERYPDLIRRIHGEGHLIGIHNYVHKTNWLMRPATVRRQIQRTNDIIYNIIGERSTYYRPPWGIVNLFDISKRRQVEIVLWSVMFGDWREKLGAQRLTEKMLARLNPGEVMLLHDSGTTLGADPGAPENMLIALELTLQEAQKRGLRSIRVDDMIKMAEKSPIRRLSFSKRVLVGLWLAWEQVFQVLFQLKTINPADPFMHYRMRKYQGEPVELGDGTLLSKGDKVIELHIDNRQLFELGIHSRSSAQLAIRMIRRMEKGLPMLAEVIADDVNLAQAKALYGVSMINRGPEKFGFSVHDLPDGIFARSTKFYLKILLSVIHPDGGARLKERSEVLVPKLILMPVSELFKKMNKQLPHDERSVRKRKPQQEEALSLNDSLTEVELPGATVTN
ncbi:polysaccharide deacetylase family protein [Paenibacillus sp. VTT E-133280]|jgi:peptidoglycan/xylan/chitin deacetylase (PgdA/CDA1 family)|uniref:polysaccharide deacetylase family protein n=1 Tax=unclassified Paenibacillus TaxID=185978 RepID=UPI000BA109F2|nr:MULTISPECIES: polysaccharide deacetylase family protein [unclassified Paenibacillus]OZQ65795.1 polysaccharide deacetylase family protein [Paenibacillus sp. VTT E-133280]OZQ91781.1 polysaccharide deacetylase family protein [Paenibacillus sp. VTT E-133291]